MISINVSLGELYDKYTILEIKKQQIVDNNKIEMIDTELKYLKPYIENLNLDVVLFNKLRFINKTLWDIEDSIREKEKKKEFDKEFIKIARSVYINNDIRSQIKNEINVLLKSDFVEIKSYSDY